MDIVKAFSFAFQDPDWIKKILIIGLIALIPILGWFVVLGWSLEVTRRVIQRDPNPLPDLNFGEQMGDGFRGFLVGLVYAIPVFILQLPIIISSSLVGNTSDEAATTIVLIISLCCGSLVFIYALLLAVILPAGYANFIARNKVSAGFNIGEVWGLVRAAPGAFLMVLLGTLLSGFAASIVGSLLCVVGVLFTSTLALAVNGHLYGQAYLEAVRNQSYQGA